MSGVKKTIYSLTYLSIKCAGGKDEDWKVCIYRATGLETPHSKAHGARHTSRSLTTLAGLARGEIRLIVEGKLRYVPGLCLGAGYGVYQVAKYLVPRPVQI